MPSVKFSPEQFRLGRPEFGSLEDEALNRMFGEAALMVGNGDGSAIPYDPPDVTDREIILYLIVCHLASLEKRAADGGAGFLASASEGSVSVSFTQLQGTRGEAWWNLTPCGQTYLKLSKRYAGWRYIPAPEEGGGDWPWPM
jgi:hypothetical protein